MNEKLQYAEMLEIPTSTCRISYKPPRKKLFRKKANNLEEPKMELVRKINEEESEEKEELKDIELEEVVGQTLSEEAIPENDNQIEREDNAVEDNQNEVSDEIICQTETVSIKKGKTKKPFKINIVGVQFIVIGLLVATILVTNALMPNSGINTLIASVFGVENTAEVDNRNYFEFTASLPSQNKSDIVLENGVMNISSSGSIYTPCDGVVTSLVKGTDGKYTLEIEHSQKFKTVVNGVDIVYTNVGEKVYSNVPVGYINTSGASMCFYGEDGAVITDYTIGEDALVWAD